VRNPAYTYQGPPPVSLAERLDKLARDSRDVSEEDSLIASQMAIEVRFEATAGALEAARKAAMEARIDKRELELESARFVTREAARDAERRYAADAVDASSAREISNANAVSLATSRRRRAATAAANELPILFLLDALPDSIASFVLREMGDYELASTMCVSRRFKDLALCDDALWGIVQRRHNRWPPRRGRNETWRAAFTRGTAVDQGWRRGRFEMKNHRAHSEYTQCVAMMGDLFVSGSKDTTLAVVGLPPRTARPAKEGDSGNPTDWETNGDWETNENSEGTGRGGKKYRAHSNRGWEKVLARCFGHDEIVTCCKLLGDGADAASTPRTIFSGDARGEMRLWDLRNAPVMPWEEIDHRDDDDNANANARPYQVPCVSQKKLTSPATGLPHSQFFDINNGAGATRAACSGDIAGAGVHVYDVSRFGAATERFDLPGISVYGVAWGGDSFDANLVYVACDDGIVRRFDTRTSSQKPVCEAASTRVVGDTFLGTADTEQMGHVHDESQARTRESKSNGNEELSKLPQRNVRRSGAAKCVATSNGGLFCFGSARGTVHVRDVRNPGVPLCLKSETKRWHDDCVNSVAIDTNVRRVVSGGDDGAVRWARLPFDRGLSLGGTLSGGDDDDNHFTQTQPPSISTGVGALAVAFDHSRLVVGCVDTTVRVYDAVTGNDFVDSEALKEAWRGVCMRARDTGNLSEDHRPAMRGGQRGANSDWGN
jgi:WD40 repeat protein